MEQQAGHGTLDMGVVGSSLMKSRVTKTFFPKWQSHLYNVEIALITLCTFLLVALAIKPNANEMKMSR